MNKTSEKGWDVKCVNIHEMKILEREERERKEKTTEEIMDENIPNLWKNSNLHIQEPQKTSSRINVQKDPQINTS